jgi:MFS family permease
LTDPPLSLTSQFLQGVVLHAAAIESAIAKCRWKLLRFLLGVAEAGFSPGVILYLTYWFPAQRRGQAIGIYYFGLPMALMLGSPLSGWLLEMHGMFSLTNWQWMFLMEGLAAIWKGAPRQAILR